MGRYLTSDLYKNYHDKQSIYKTTFDMCIQAGLDNPDKMSCGLVAGDEMCYDTFSKLFDPVIADRHYGFTRDNAVGFGKSILNLKDKLVGKTSFFYFGDQTVVEIKFKVKVCTYDKTVIPSRRLFANFSLLFHQVLNDYSISLTWLGLTRWTHSLTNYNTH